MVMKSFVRTPMARLFGILFVVCLIVYLIGYYSIFTLGNTGLVVLLIPASWGTGIFFILFLVMFVLKR